MNFINAVKAKKRELGIKRVLLRDINLYKGFYSTSEWANACGNKSARDILVFCHVVEKGLSHKRIKPLFGYERVCLIADSLNNYIKKGGNDEYIIGIAVSTLKHYNDINESLGVAKDKLISIPEVNISNDLCIGVKELSAEEYFSYSSSPFSSLSKARRSIRLYDCSSEPIDVNEIMSALDVAQQCPSACNRQAVRVKVVMNKDKIATISEIQGGSKGFGENAGAMIIVTSDISLYEPEERRIPMLDCGLFIMNLLYALYEKRIGSCVLNGSFSVDREIKMRKVVPIPQNEMYAAVIALSKIPQDEVIIVANSIKRNLKDIVAVIE